MAITEADLVEGCYIRDPDGFTAGPLSKTSGMWRWPTGDEWANYSPGAVVVIPPPGEWTSPPRTLREGDFVLLRCGVVLGPIARTGGGSWVVALGFEWVASGRACSDFESQGDFIAILDPADRRTPIAWLNGGRPDEASAAK